MKMTLKELMIVVVGAMTKYVNIERISKVIDEFLANGGNEDNLNDLLLAYYVDTRYTWRQSWAFDLEKYVEINKITIIDFEGDK